ncbi:Tn3 family transposase [Nonomuraea aurantiaca]|uniref:Tn3 family transposase n=1 Tax=Nonomuraea aurantiaca TaxID=2878562 RepID=UPI001CD99E5F|nr:Tn3 family transposase [Nonomuraea aurantiaca]MCA2222344.1 Tn3 family transposase [Nonomuraea aurantiaca]
MKITRKKGEPWISVPPLGKQEEPTGLKARKAEISRRWGVIDLLDVLKDVAHVTDYTDAFTSVASRIVIDPAVLQRRLLLCLYGLGTNVGIKRVADGVAAAGPVLVPSEPVWPLRARHESPPGTGRRSARAAQRPVTHGVGPRLAPLSPVSPAVYCRIATTGSAGPVAGSNGSHRCTTVCRTPWSSCAATRCCPS